MQLIDGKAIAGEVRAQCAQESAALQEKGIVPSLTVILVGEDPASQVYVRNKERACRACGVRSRVIRLPKDAPQHVLMDAIASVNADESVHGLLVQLPLPAHLDEQAAIRAIDPRKDVDGFHPVNAGLLLEGQDAPLTPCTPTGCIELLAPRKRAHGRRVRGGTGAQQHRGQAHGAHAAAGKLHRDRLPLADGNPGRASHRAGGHTGCADRPGAASLPRTWSSRARR